MTTLQWRRSSVTTPLTPSKIPRQTRTRVPAETIVAYLKAGRTNVEIFEDYPTLPIDGIAAVLRWAEKTIGSNWKNAPEQDDRGH